jgi:hypothetical protein
MSTRPICRAIQRANEKSRPGVTPNGFLMQLPTQSTLRFRRISVDAGTEWLTET